MSLKTFKKKEKWTSLSFTGSTKRRSWGPEKTPRSVEYKGKKVNRLLENLFNIAYKHWVKSKKYICLGEKKII